MPKRKTPAKLKTDGTTNANAEEGESTPQTASQEVATQTAINTLTPQTDTTKANETIISTPATTSSTPVQQKKKITRKASTPKIEKTTTSSENNIPIATTTEPIKTEEQNKTVQQNNANNNTLINNIIPQQANAIQNAASNSNSINHDVDVDLLATTAMVNTTNTLSDAEKKKKRAERFGAVVSDKMKKIDEHERLMKRKERFGAVTASTVSSNTKQTITFSPDTDDRKRRRLERFGVS